MDADASTRRLSDERGRVESPRYFVITPARNEAAFIELTLKSMIRQTVRPARWVIVSDGSTDGTDDIVEGYARSCDWIQLLRMPERAERHFAGKVHAFNAGYDLVKDLPHEVVANVDADVSLPEDLFEHLLTRFTDNPELGVAGAAYLEDSVGSYNYEIVNVEDVSGACQLFRRRCFEEIGGYTPIKGGGIDSAAVFTARMKGWQTRTFTDQTFIHHRRRFTGQGSFVASFFRSGKRDYYLGGHPLWELLRALYHMKNKPAVVGGMLILSGYLWEWLRGVEIQVPPELVAFRRKEQMQRLKEILRKNSSF